MNLRRIKLQLCKEVNHLLSVLYFVGGLFEGWEDRTIAHSVNFIYFFFCGKISITKYVLKANCI